MKSIFIIRHGESTANAGERTDAHDTIPLSEKGKAQAENLAKEFSVTPDLIIVSPFTRTQETARPFIEKHITVPVEMWDVHEFTYLDPKVCNGTTKEERSVAVKKYWNALDVHYQDGDEAETFALFIDRIRTFVKKLQSRQEKTIVIFSHGAFIQNLKTYLEMCSRVGDKEWSEGNTEELMKLFQETGLGGKNPIENVSVHRIEVDMSL